MARLLDPKKPGQKDFPFSYVPAANTDIRETFERARREQQQKKSQVVTPIRKVGP